MRVSSATVSGDDPYYEALRTVMMTDNGTYGKRCQGFVKYPCAG